MPTGYYDSIIPSSPTPIQESTSGVQQQIIYGSATVGALILVVLIGLAYSKWKRKIRSQPQESNVVTSNAAKPSSTHNATNPRKTTSNARKHGQPPKRHRSSTQSLLDTKDGSQSILNKSGHSEHIQIPATQNSQHAGQHTALGHLTDILTSRKVDKPADAIGTRETPSTSIGLVASLIKPLQRNKVHVTFDSPRSESSSSDTEPPGYHQTSSDNSETTSQPDITYKVPSFNYNSCPPLSKNPVYGPFNRIKWWARAK